LQSTAAYLSDPLLALQLNHPIVSVPQMIIADTSGTNCDANQSRPPTASTTRCQYSDTPDRITKELVPSLPN
jgi:hypothetical protein